MPRTKTNEQKKKKTNRSPPLPAPRRTASGTIGGVVRIYYFYITGTIYCHSNRARVTPEEITGPYTHVRAGTGDRGISRPVPRKNSLETARLFSVSAQNGTRTMKITSKKITRPGNHVRCYVIITVPETFCNLTFSHRTLFTFTDPPPPPPGPREIHWKIRNSNSRRARAYRTRTGGVRR